MGKEISRRRFLKLSALAAAGTALAACRPDEPKVIAPTGEPENKLPTVTPAEKPKEPIATPAKEPVPKPERPTQTAVPIRIGNKTVSDLGVQGQELVSAPEPTSIAKPATERNEKQEGYLEFLGQIQEKVAEKRLVRAENDPFFWNRVDADLNKHRVNVLLLGLDRRTEEERDGPSGAWRADAPVIVSVNTQSGQIDLLRIPRDLHAPEVDDLTSEHKGYPFRINAVTVFGDLKDARPIFENATGLASDFCFSLDFEAFRETVDILGGVEIDVDPKFVESYAREIENWLDGDFQAGRQLLSGDRAFNYVHWRAKDGDYSRGQRQLQMVKAIARTTLDRMKQNPVLTTVRLGQLILRLKEQEGIDFASEFSLFEVISLLNQARKIDVGSVADEFVDHSPWGELVYAPWTNEAEGDTLEYKERHQLFLKDVPIKDPANPLDYWRPLRNYVAQNFK